MRLPVLAAMVLQWAACTCGKPLDAYCKNRWCDPEPVQAVRLSEEAEREWLTGRNACGGLEGGACASGGRWLLDGRGPCFTRSFFDRSGALVFVETGCEGEDTEYGRKFDCERRTDRNLCEEARSRVKLRHVWMTFDGPGSWIVDGAPVDGGSPVDLALGHHRVSLDQHVLEVELAQPPGSVGPQVRLADWDRAIDVAVAGKLLVRGDIRDCQLPQCGYRIGASGRDPQGSLTFTPVIALVDGGSGAAPPVFGGSRSKKMADFKSE